MQNNLRFPAHNYADTFGLTAEKTTELHAKMRIVLRNYREQAEKSKANGDTGMSTDGILKGFTDLAETEAELHYLIFQSGMKIHEAKELLGDSNLSILAGILASMK